MQCEGHDGDDDGVVQYTPDYCKFTRRVAVQAAAVDMHVETDYDDVAATIDESFLHARGSGNNVPDESRVMFGGLAGNSVVELSQEEKCVEGRFGNGTRFVAEDASGMDWSRHMERSKESRKRKRRRSRGDDDEVVNICVDDDLNEDEGKSGASQSQAKRTRVEAVCIAPSKKERIVGNAYRVQDGKFEGQVMVWGKYGWLCLHGRRPDQCRYCGGSGICEHGRIRSKCKACGGGHICEHGRERSKCKECGGGSICEHGRRRSQCKECRNT